MAQRLLNPFDHRQVMQKENFEVFHYNNPATCSCPPHQHDFFEMFYLMGKGVDYIVEGLRYHLDDGDIMLIPPGQMHRPDVPGPVRNIERFVLWLSVDYVRALTESLPRLRYVLQGDIRGRNLIRLDGDTAALARQLLFALHREAYGQEADGDYLSHAIVTQLLIHCGRRIARDPDFAPHKAELRYHEIIRVYEHILAHLKDKDLSVGALAETFFMDKNTLTRQFKRQVGMTPGECIRRHRLEAARRLIHRGMPAQRACVECGFFDYSAFYRAFRQAFGVSPSEYAARAEADRGGAPDDRQEANAV